MAKITLMFRGVLESRDLGRRVAALARSRFIRASCSSSSGSVGL
jgi:hypothetical protein